jgi:hypothetical protein
MRHSAIANENALPVSLACETHLCGFSGYHSLNNSNE